MAAPPFDVVPRVEFGVLGQKWALSILQDVAFRRRTRFSEILRANAGLTPRVLSRRLREMCDEGLLARTGAGPGVRYELTQKGVDAAFVLLALLRYGTIHAGPAT